MAKRGVGRKRRNFFVNKSFQFRFGMIIFVSMVVAGVIAFWTSYVTTYDEISRQMSSSTFYQQINHIYKTQPNDRARETQIRTLVSVKFTSIFDVVSKTLSGRMIFVTVLFFVGSLFAAHKIAGPLYRIQRVARAIRQGDLSMDVHSLRAGDEMRELAAEMNAAVEKIRHLMERYRGLAGQLSRLVAELVVTETPTSAMAEDAKKVREELQLISNQLVTEINYFKLRKETVTQNQVG